jgi:hypothetical protein
VADVLAINYSRDAGWAGGLIVEICRDQPSTALVTFNYDGGRELGVYLAALPAAVFLQAAELVTRSGYAQLPIAVETGPEAKFLVIGERRQGEALPVLRPFELIAIPPAVAALGRDLEATVVAQIRKHPSRVVEVNASWAKPAFDPGEPLGVRVALRGAGALPVACGNPLGAPPGGWCGLRLFLRDVAGKGREESVDLEAGHLRPPPEGRGGGKALLAPGATLAFEIRKKVYLTPGAYSARLSYQNVADDPDDPQFVRGEVVLDLGPVVVERGRGA